VKANKQKYKSYEYDYKVLQLLLTLWSSGTQIGTSEIICNKRTIPSNIERLSYKSIDGMQTSVWLECVKRKILLEKAFRRVAVTNIVNTRESNPKKFLLQQ
jgi:hypothetical protein